MPFPDEDEWYGGCDLCESPLDETGECSTCCPAIPIINTPIIASFAIDTTTGAVTWAGACTEAYGALLEHIP